MLNVCTFEENLISSFIGGQTKEKKKKEKK